MRPIDADALKNHLEDLRSYTKLGEGCLYYDGETNALSVAIQNIDNAPTLDAVPVVRCKECKYALPALNGFDEEGFGCSNEHTPGYESFWWFEPDWFCAGGERREE